MFMPLCEIGKLYLNKVRQSLDALINNDLNDKLIQFLLDHKNLLDSIEKFFGLTCPSNHLGRTLAYIESLRLAFLYGYLTSNSETTRKLYHRAFVLTSVLENIIKRDIEIINIIARYGQSAYPLK